MRLCACDWFVVVCFVLFCLFVCLFVCFVCLFVCFFVLGFFLFLFQPIDVVTFRLLGWCILDVFLLPAFTSLGHECQDRLSQYNGKHVCTD